MFAPLDAAGMPVHFLPGNHDNREAFWKAFPGHRAAAAAAPPDKHVRIVESDRVNWFLLDSLEQTDHTPGHLGQPQLDWLSKSLGARPDKPALVLAHHHLDFENKIHGLTDTAALVDVLTAHKQVKAYLHGHTHCWSSGEVRGLRVVSLPTLVWVFDAKQPRGWVDARASDAACLSAWSRSIAITRPTARGSR